MRAALLALGCACVVTLVPAPASAHFYIDYPDAAVYPGPSPVPWWHEDGLGSPQKLGPCGDEDDGTMAGGGPTGVITPLMPGQTVTLEWTETISHAGWFRVAIAADRSSFVDPPIYVNSAGNSADAGIESPPVPPVIADGLYRHASGSAPKAYPPFTFTVPNITCTRCTIQVIQIMLDHPSNLGNLPDGAPNPDGFLYHHCMDVSIGVPPQDGGIPPAPDGGTTGGSPDGGTTGSPDGGSAFSDTGSSGGCSIGAAAPAAGGIFAVAALAVAMRRRRRS